MRKRLTPSVFFFEVKIAPGTVAKAIHPLSILQTCAAEVLLSFFKFLYLSIKILKQCNFCSVVWFFTLGCLLYNLFSPFEGSSNKVLTYVEYRAVSGVFQNIDPPFPPSECVLPRTKGGGVHTRRAVRGWGFNILEDARHRIDLLQYNLSTGPVHILISEQNWYVLKRVVPAYR